MCVYLHTHKYTHTHMYKCIGHEKYVFKSLTSVSGMWLDNVKITFKQLSQRGSEIPILGFSQATEKFELKYISLT